ncbi:hypothetical protein FHG87_014906 [Trinorchestia longiramus]|nr:hypothetical protein FHG87_014906 [Trinorchestia longiramus]
MPITARYSTKTLILCVTSTHLRSKRTNKRQLRVGVCRDTKTGERESKRRKRHGGKKRGIGKREAQRERKGTKREKEEKRGTKTEEERRDKGRVKKKKRETEED